ncbi:MAG: hypothetical protein JO334_09455 [Verrucomicrobia bacterium]|nr:hypothetical protein [Verrucomicrobiota bacterium]
MRQNLSPSTTKMDLEADLSIFDENLVLPFVHPSGGKFCPPFNLSVTTG